MTKAKKTESVFVIHRQKGETDEQALARTVLSPALQSAGTIQQYSNSPINLDLAALIECLDGQVDQLKVGNLNRIEQMLLAQAHTLDAIANNLFRRAKAQEYLRQFESSMKLGLRAQSQCRSTLEALVSMRKPTHLNQTNIGYNQQVNNVAEKSDSPNELVEENPCEKRLDEAAPTEAVPIDVGVNSHLETVGTRNRTTKS